ncbi:regulatory protein [Streptomyces bingchenggensis BCW-1]|uniref:Regulatory protein n=1 Tax=Streptomyces bingchenggensis (strain BCW-1) TaxID=749414 RepID=D7BTV1_STRBB|nr:MULTISPECIES: ATP-binding protein [Streptomyces]ADI09520.1 regulatory protein [Streptomyces bingchenggensis BCW-1]
MLKANTLPDEGVRLPSTPRGARLARRFAVRRMREWGFPPASDTSCTVALLVAELASNAVRHGRVPGRDFRLRITVEVPTRTIRIEVSDAREGRLPVRPPNPSAEDETGRGLLLVELLATRWGVAPRAPVGKTVWAEVAAGPCD